MLHIASVSQPNGDLSQENSNIALEEDINTFISLLKSAKKSIEDGELNFVETDAKNKKTNTTVFQELELLLIRVTSSENIDISKDDILQIGDVLSSLSLDKLNSSQHNSLQNLISKLTQGIEDNINTLSQQSRDDNALNMLLAYVHLKESISPEDSDTSPVSDKVQISNVYKKILDMPLESIYRLNDVVKYMQTKPKLQDVKTIEQLIVMADKKGLNLTKLTVETLPSSFNITNEDKKILKSLNVNNTEENQPIAKATKSYFDVFFNKDIKLNSNKQEPQITLKDLISSMRELKNQNPKQTAQIQTIEKEIIPKNVSLYSNDKPIEKADIKQEQPNNNKNISRTNTIKLSDIKATNTVENNLIDKKEPIITTTKLSDIKATNTVENNLIDKKEPIITTTKLSDIKATNTVENNLIDKKEPIITTTKLSDIKATNTVENNLIDKKEPIITTTKLSDIKVTNTVENNLIDKKEPIITTTKLSDIKVTNTVENNLIDKKEPIITTTKLSDIKAVNMVGINLFDKTKKLDKKEPIITTTKLSDIKATNILQNNLIDADVKTDTPEEIKQQTPTILNKAQNISDMTQSIYDENNIKIPIQDNQNTNIEETSIQQGIQSADIQASSLETNSSQEQQEIGIHSNNLTNVKETSKAEQPLPSTSMKNLIEELKERLENFKPPLMKVSLEINPHKLGKMDIEIVSRGNSLYLNFSSNQQALLLITNNLADFKNALVDIGFNDVELNFSSNEQDTKGENNQEQKEYEPIEEMLEEDVDTSEVSSVNIKMPLYM